MRHTLKLSALGFSATCFGLAADAAVGLGAAQWLADLCLTEPGDMGDMAMEPVTPTPFLVLSSAFATLGFGILLSEDRDAALGRTVPNPADYADILSAIVMTAAASGQAREQDIATVFQIATGTALEPDLAAFAFRRFQDFDRSKLDATMIGTSDDPLARRRTIAAALLMGCVANRPTRKARRVIERLIVSIGATPQDVAATKAAIGRWTASDSGLTGTPLLTLLKSKPLGLRPS